MRSSDVRLLVRALQTDRNLEHRADLEQNEAHVADSVDTVEVA